MIFRAAFQVVVVASCLALIGCPVTVKVEVTNESESEITILYSTGYESTIDAGETKKEIYKFACFRIRTEGQLYEYQQVRPLDSYFDTGISSSTIYALFTKEKEFKIYKKDGTFSDMIELKRGCDK